MIIHNEWIRDLIQPEYTHDTLQKILSLLDQHKTFHFHPLANGLFSAVSASAQTDYTGYSYVWVRDNIHIAHAHYATGKKDAAVRTLNTLMEYFNQYKSRFENIILDKSSCNDPMDRPHIRFDGNTLSELNQKWAHAQNDALGYFLWLYCKCVSDGLIILNEDAEYMILLFVRYFQQIEYWQDEDSGHWEEVRKISASSIGAVIAGLGMVKRLQRDGRINKEIRNILVDEAQIENLISKGKESLHSILPFECKQNDSLKNRRYDAALLFLIYPLDMIAPEMCDVIIKDVTENLMGEYGIKRYIGDSYWCADYKTKLNEEVRTSDYSDNQEQRDELLNEGEEAQWCIFDSILSVIYGIRYSMTRNHEHWKLQTYYFNRSLGQLTCEDHPHGGLQCPESYYIEDGHYVTSDIVPLLWAEANLMLAIEHMKNSLAT